MASVRGSLLGSEKEVESLSERIQELTKESETNHEILKKLQVMKMTNADDEQISYDKSR